MRVLKLIIAIFFLATLFNPVVSAASLRFNPSTGNVNVACNARVDVIINTQGQPSNAADIKIFFNPSQITVRDADQNRPGVQARQGNAYEGYFINDVWQDGGVITLAAGSFGTDLNGEAIFASIEFTAKEGQTNADFSIEYTAYGSSYDSNVASSLTSTDILSSVGSANLTMVQSECPSNVPDDSDPEEEDNIPPTFTFVSPNEYGRVENGQITFVLSDDLSGVDIESVSFYINGQLYTPYSDSVTFTGDPSAYTFTVRLPDSLNDAEVYLLLNVRDFAGNALEIDTIFNANLTTQISQTVSQRYDNLVSEIFEGTPLSGSLVEAVAQNIEPNMLIPLFLLLSAILPFLSFLSTPVLLLNLFSFLFGKKHKKPWGIVLDATTNKPIAFAVCRIYNAGSKFLIDQTVSDLEGRYSFLLQAGQYRLEVHQTGYTKFAKDLVIEQGEESYVYDVRLFPNNLQSHEVSFVKRIMLNTNRFIRKLSRPLFVIGFVIAIIAVVLNPDLYNSVVMALYCIFLVGYIYGKYFYNRKYASVIDHKTNLKIPFAIVKVFDPVSFKLIDTQTTNRNGEFDFWGEEGSYGILVAASGYKFPSSRYHKSDIIGKTYMPMVRVNLKNGKNRVKVYVDFDESNSYLVNTQTTETAVQNITNLPNPFG